MHLNKDLNKGHALLAHADHAWMPFNTSGQGTIIQAIAQHETGVLTGVPTWVETPFGRGIQTDNLKYVDLKGVRVGAPATCFVAYMYRYDASTAGAATETGILLSAGFNGLSFRHNGTTVEALKSHTASLVSGTVPAPSRAQFHTAALTISFGALPNCLVYYDGRLVNSTTSANATSLSGTNITALGYDYHASTPEYGRHTILFAMWSGRRVYSSSDIFALHEAARMRFRPLFIRRLIYSGISSDVSGSVSKGFSFGGSFSAEENVAKGFSLGATLAVDDIAGNVIHGFSLGSEIQMEPTLTKGFALGATVKVDEQYAATTKGISLGARTQSNSGDLANGRYRR